MTLLHRLLPLRYVPMHLLDSIAVVLHGTLKVVMRVARASTFGRVLSS